MTGSMRQKIAMRQSQSLVMTPQLRQSIAMLQMATPELAAHIASEVEANPLLSLADGIGSAALQPKATAAAGVDRVMARSDLAQGTAQFQNGRDNLLGGSDLPPTRAVAVSPDAADSAARVADTPSLCAHVAAQIGLMRLSPAARAAALHMAGELDDDGYLRTPDATLVQALGVGEDVVAEARRAIHRCEPTGVGASDLAEVLRLQLAERERLDPAMERLLGMLECLPTTPAAMLARDCGVSLDVLRDMLGQLRTLDPRPGRKYAAGTAMPTAPDVLVQPDADAGWRVMLNPSALPRLLVDREYAASVSMTPCKQTRTFLSECLQEATWLRRSLDQRARTILKVASELVRVQAAFFDRGSAGLKPLTLRMVAEAVGMHESTVSRVIANKMMGTPRGTVPMKLFFSASIAAADGGEAHAAEAVRERIRALVSGEAPGRPLSDDMLVRRLSAEGIDVARRTVAKYREALLIPSSVERRRRAAAAV